MMSQIIDSRIERHAAKLQVSGAKIPAARCRAATPHVALTSACRAISGRRCSIRNSKTSVKIRRISRTVRRIDSCFRGRCYEMDPCTAPESNREERKRETEKERDRRAHVRERTREKREDLSVAKLSSTSFASSPSRRPTIAAGRDGHPRYPSAERPSRPVRPLLLPQIYKISHFVIELSRRERRGRKFDGIAQLIPSQRSSVVALL